MAECPKCAALSDDDAVDCPQCGVVFAKFQRRAAVAALGAAATGTRAGPVSAALRDPTIGLVEYILAQLGWLHLDRTLGPAAHRAGLAIMFGALVWGATHLVRHRDSFVLTFPEESA